MFELVLLPLRELSILILMAFHSSVFRMSVVMAEQLVSQKQKTK